MGEDQDKPDGSTQKRVEALEGGLQRVQGRLDGLERTTRGIEGDMRVMKRQIESMQASIQEMLMIFRALQEKLRRQAEQRPEPRPSSPDGWDGTGKVTRGDEVVRSSRPADEDY